MPPVLGPSSPSKARLWSCAVPKGSTVLPSQSAKKLASSPSRNSSTTAEAPGAAEDRVERRERGGAVGGDGDALAGGEPVRLHHDGEVVLHHIGARSVAVGEAAVVGGRDAGLAAEILGEALGAFELRRRFRRAEGADAGGRKIVDEAGDERRLRPDDDEVDRLARQKATTAAWSAGSSGTHSATPQMPALPGAAKSFVSSGEADSAQASACSRPPEPMRRTRIAASPGCRIRCGRIPCRPRQRETSLFLDVALAARASRTT